MVPDSSFLGESSDDQAGQSVAGAGDVNADGYDDLLIGARYNDEGGINAGQAYLILGCGSGWALDTDLYAADASFLGEADGDLAGATVAGAGDVDGDGYDDLLISAPNSSGGVQFGGQVYLVLGASTGWAPDEDLAYADASFHGEEPGDYAGSAIAAAGDVNGDGYDDILIASPDRGEAGFRAGQAYLVMGDPAGWGMDQDLGGANASFLGEEAGDEAGSAVAGAGDVNGDGYDDLVVGAGANQENGSEAGQAYLVLGRSTGWTVDADLGGADASFLGEDDGDGAGGSVAGAGDVDGDGYDDLLIGAPYADWWSDVGEVYLVLGRDSGWTMDTPLSTADAAFFGEWSHDNAGMAADGVGDVNDDGYDDILVGSLNNDEAGSDAGQAYLILGRDSGWIHGAWLSLAGGYFLGEAAGDGLGNAVAGAGDVDGDGYDDLVMGARSNDGNGTDSGEVYVSFGFPDVDDDGDGLTSYDGDCDDQSATVHLGAPEACDGLDNDCDQITDEACGAHTLAATASFLGESLNDEAGRFVAGAGDINGDGYDDTLITGWKNDEGGENAGKVYVVLGKAEGWDMDTPLSSADASFIGEGEEDEAGWSVGGVGDVDADGYDDILIGARENDDNGDDAGQVYLVRGDPGGWGSSTHLSFADASWVGEAEDDRAGHWVAGTGDVDGDGLDDFLIGAPYSDEADDNAGQAYLVTGGSISWSLNNDLSTADASFQGEEEDDYAGRRMAGGGDVDGDGFDDLLIAAYYNDEAGNGAGQVYLVLGKSSGWAMDTDLSAVDASLVGEAAGDEAGFSVAMAADVNGDGLDDMLIGALFNDAAFESAGQAYLILGRTLGWTMDASLSYADASFLGESWDDCAGVSVAGAGDIDGDGLDDLWIGALNNDENGMEAGQAYLVLGATSGWTMDTPLSTATAVFIGEVAGDYAGRSTAGAGDVNGDGHDDLLVGAYTNDENGLNAGQAYLLSGFPCEDADGDGVDLCDGDCDDVDPATYPGAPDDPCDGIDNDCSGPFGELNDDDGDGYTPCDGDCDDDDPALNLDDLDGDGYATCDGDCDDDDPALNLDDNDGDSFHTCSGECDDGNAAIHPGVSEICNGIDDNCNEVIDESADVDGDGYTLCEGDCDDSDPAFHPGAVEQCDGLDNDCDGSLAAFEVDSDGDGYLACEDCDDEDDGIHPGATEICDDGIDGDCQGDLEETEVDDDGDGYSECGGDCDDLRDDTHPGAEEICNGFNDDDCDENTHELDDNDQDGFTICDEDCDDDDSTTYPGAEELCDGADNDCNGDVDEGIDYDSDGYLGCGGDDCNDYNPFVNPGAEEVPYNGVDDDCVEGDLTDVDGDGVDGEPIGGDCNDLDPTQYPGAVEDCDDGLDGDCDGLDDASDGDCGGAQPDDDEDGAGGGTCACSEGSDPPASRTFLPGILLVASSFAFATRLRRR